MIEVLVTDDDYRVARIHAACVDATPGFRCVGEAHTAAETRDLVARLSPDLLLLDIYLPDQDGLSLLRALAGTVPSTPDCIVISAARDLESVRRAIGLGAMYYLVKPFRMHQLKDQLIRYQRWRNQVDGTDSSTEADQDAVDHLYALRHAPTERRQRSALAPTMARVLDVLATADRPLSAADIAELVGISRPTAQRYLSDLERRRLVVLQLRYGATGRPTHHYRPVPPTP